MSKMYIAGLFVVLAVVKARPQISLEYKPMRPFYHPRPSGTYPSQIIPPGKPWPDSDNYQNFSQVPSIVDRTKETQSENKPSSSNAPSSGFLWPSDTEDEQIEVTELPPKAPTTTNRVTLEYRPTRPPHHPKPGDNIHPIVPPGKPWPSKPEDYPTTIAPVIVDRIKEESLQTTSPATQKQTPISLEYKPTRPFYHPNPGNNINQIIPPGEPWPDSPEGYQNFSQVGNSPDLVNKIKETTLSNIVTTTKRPQETLSLEYQPNRPSFHPNPGNNVNQIVPPGEPWPSSPEGYQNFSQMGSSSDCINRIKGTTPPTTVTTKKKEETINLEYQPNRPSFHPNPGNNINQIVPPGERWPDSPEGYKNFSQVLPVPNLLDRVKETEDSSTTKQTPAATRTQTPISLEYKPTRPFYHPNPGDTLEQIVPPGQPWPDSPEGYQNFSQSTPLPDLLGRLKDFVDKKKGMEKTTTPKESSFIWKIETTSNPEKNLIQSEQPKPETTNSTDYNLAETSTVDADLSTFTTHILTDQRLYTSAPFEINNKEDKIS